MYGTRDEFKVYGYSIAHDSNEAACGDELSRLMQAANYDALANRMRTPNTPFQSSPWW